MVSTPRKIVCKRVYAQPEADDGYRVLVDRTWPRGIKKEDLNFDSWRKDLAPSTELRKWFGHEPRRWAGFYQRYHAELKTSSEAVMSLLSECDGGKLTLLYSASDTERNNAVALKMYIEGLTSAR